MTLSHRRLEAVLNRPFRYYNTVNSTNDLAQEWLQQGAVAGSSVIADEQLKGRGRKGRYWYTPPDVALAVSVILKPAQDNAHKISMLGGVAVAELCESLGIVDVGIKWPNDVQIAGKKVSGILPEAVWRDEHLLGVVLGIGVNVRVPFTEELAAIATNLETACSCQLDRARLIATLIERVMFWSDHMSDVFAAWESRLNMIGQQVQIDQIVGIAQGVEESGALLINTVDATMHRVLAGDLSLIEPQDED